jgi:hypothetical protein
MKPIAALFVERRGPYARLPGVDLWDRSRDARKYRGPHPVVAHPPCERWGRYWSGGPSAAGSRKLGDDEGCFASALSAVRLYGGVLEHPEGSHAFKKFLLPIPDQLGGWTEPDLWGGASCCVAQGHYGHPSQKLTLIYASKGVFLPELRWGLAPGKTRLDRGYHNAEERAVGKHRSSQLITKTQRIFTPNEFRDVLILMARSYAA